MITPELNTQLWILAESGDEKQIQAFITENPDLKAELLARRGMITGIKGSKPEKKSARERFMPSPDRNPTGPPKWAALLATTVLVGGAAFATIGTLRYLETRSPATTTLEPQNTKPLAASNAPQQANEPLVPDVATNQPTQLTPDQTPPIIEVRPIDQPVTIVASNIQLTDALNDIAIQAGIRLNSAPGMPDPSIQIDFRNVPALEVLKAIGQQLGFTPMVETSSTILLVPARDPNAPNTNSSGLVNPAPLPSNTGSGLLPIPTTPYDQDGSNTIRDSR